MSKVVVVMDEPECCGECYMRFNAFGSNMCVLVDARLHIADAIIENRAKACFCPLKELPDDIKPSSGDDEWDSGYTTGWNELRYKILGGSRFK